MRWPTLKCPFCGCALPNRQYKARQALTCPGCSRRLILARWYLNFTTAIAFILTLLVCWLFRIHGWWLLPGFVLLWFPTDLVWTFLFVRIIPPKFELSKAEPDNDLTLFR